MKRVGGWLGASSKTGGSLSSSKSLTALDEPQALQDAMKAASLILNDEVEKAEVELSKGTSPFHKLGVATTLFLRATLGFEKEIMEQAASRLAEAEESASEHQRRAVRDPSTAHQSRIYPPGAEYALCTAESQLMSAVVAVLTESLTESLKGFYRLRKAFATLQELLEAENRYLEKYLASSTSSLATTSTEQAHSNHTLNSSRKGSEDDSDSDLDFEDAKEGGSSEAIATTYQGHLDIPDMSRLDLDNHSQPGRQVPDAPLGGTNQLNGAPDPNRFAKKEDIDFTSISSDPLDLFIHSGIAMCFGLLQLILSLIPPAFSRVLSIFSFRGDRENGLRLLWKATAFKHNVNGGLAGLITLGFHNAAVALCDIHLRQAYPKDRIRALLKDMRELYPDSLMWLLEEARMANAERDLNRAISVLRGNSIVSPLKQVEALRVFESSLTLLFLHRYEECAASFIKCVDLNSWSHGMYYYNAGCAYVELYRINKVSDPRKAAQYKDKAQELLLNQVTKHVGKKRFMARQLPLDVFITRKIEKWTHRARARKCDFVDAIGVSPVEEMAYFWSGHRRMPNEQLAVSLERLDWTQQHDPNWTEEPVDEHAIYGMLRATCLRNMGNVEEAKQVLADQVFCHDLQRIKACDHADNWPLPVGHYEHACCLWQEAGGQDGDKIVLQRCSAELSRVEKWESFEMDARIGLKLTTARESLRRLGIV